MCGLFFAYCSATGVTARLALLFLSGLLRDARLPILLLFLLAWLAILLLLSPQFVAIGLPLLGNLPGIGRGVFAVGLALRVVVHVLLHRSDLLPRHCVLRPVTQLHRITRIMNSHHEQPLVHTGY